MARKRGRRTFANDRRMALNGIKSFYPYSESRQWATLLNVRIAKQWAVPDMLAVEEMRGLLETVDICRWATSTRRG